MEYFDCTAPSGNGLCSDNNCPCPEVVIPRGQGYLFISKELVDFRSKYRSEEEANMAMRAKLAVKQVMMGMGGLNVKMLYSISPILVCEQGAKLRKLDLKVAGEDAAHWWKTGKVPLRPTPTLESGDIDQESSGNKRQQRVTNENLLTDATQQNDISVDETFNSLLMDMLCCMMCADLKVKKSELETICKILKEYNIPWDRNEVEKRLKIFIQSARSKGVPYLIEKTVQNIQGYRVVTDKKHVLIDCIVRVMESDNDTDTREMETLEQFKTALSNSSTPTKTISTDENNEPTKNLSSHKKDAFGQPIKCCDKCNIGWTEAACRNSNIKVFNISFSGLYKCIECGTIFCLACAILIERFGAIYAACPDCKSHSRVIPN